MPYKKLIKELSKNRVNIEIELEWDECEGTYEVEGFLFDHLPSFDLLFDIYVRQTGYETYGTHMQPPEFIETGSEEYITEISAFEKSSRQEIELTPEQVEEVEDYLITLIKS